MKSFNFLCAPEDKIFYVTDDEIVTYVVSQIIILDCNGRCLYAAYTSDKNAAKRNRLNIGCHFIAEEFNRYLYTSMEEAIKALRQKKGETHGG